MKKKRKKEEEEREREKKECILCIKNMSHILLNNNKIKKKILHTPPRSAGCSATRRSGWSGSILHC
jgi:hypothetical protein